VGTNWNQKKRGSWAAKVVKTSGGCLAELGAHPAVIAKPIRVNIMYNELMCHRENDKKTVVHRGLSH